MPDGAGSGSARQGVVHDMARLDPVGRALAGQGAVRGKCVKEASHGYQEDKRYRG